MSGPLEEAAEVRARPARPGADVASARPSAPADDGARVAVDQLGGHRARTLRRVSDDAWQPFAERDRARRRRRASSTRARGARRARAQTAEHARPSESSPAIPRSSGRSAVMGRSASAGRRCRGARRPCSAPGAGRRRDRLVASTRARAAACAAGRARGARTGRSARWRVRRVVELADRRADHGHGRRDRPAAGHRLPDRSGVGCALRRSAPAGRDPARRAGVARARPLAAVRDRGRALTSRDWEHVWRDALLELAADGTIDRDRMLDSRRRAAAGLLAAQRALALQLHEALEPTPRSASRLDELLALLASGPTARGLRAARAREARATPPRGPLLEAIAPAMLCRSRAMPCAP